MMLLFCVPSLFFSSALLEISWAILAIIRRWGRGRFSDGTRSFSIYLSEVSELVHDGNVCDVHVNLVVDTVILREGLENHGVCHLHKRKYTRDRDWLKHAVFCNTGDYSRITKSYQTKPIAQGIAESHRESHSHCLQRDRGSVKRRVWPKQSVSGGRI